MTQAENVGRYVATLEKRIVQLQEEVESLASSLLQALQGERNAISGFKAGLAAAANQNGRIKELEAQVQKLGEQLDDSNRLELE